jgi:hypothetical protein
VEELRKRNAELVQTNQKVTKENTALRVSMLEVVPSSSLALSLASHTDRSRAAPPIVTLQARMKSKQDASKQTAPAKSKEVRDCKQSKAKRNIHTHPLDLNLFSPSADALQDVERLETELAHKDREVEEEKAGKEKALTQLKTMMKA